MPKRTKLHRDVLVTVAISAVTSGMMSLLIPASAHLLSDSAPNPLSGSQSQLKISTDGGDGGSTDNGSNGGGLTAVNPDGSGNGSNDCTLVQLQCSPTDTSCTKPPTFTHLACNDPTCQKNFALKLCTDTSCTSRVFCVPSALAKVSSDTGGGDNGTSGNTNNSGSGNGGDNSGDSKGSGDNGGTLNGGGSNSGTSGDSGQSGNGSQGGPSIPTSGDNGTSGGKLLGCFTTDGNWTTDRTACDPNQARHFQTGNADTGNSNGNGSGDNGGNTHTGGYQNNTGTSGGTGDSGNSSTGSSDKTSVEQDQQDQQLQLQLDSQFHSQSERDSAYANLVNATTTALSHMNTLSQQTLPVEAAATVAATQQWIQQLLSTLSTGEPTVEQVQQQAQDLRDKLAETQSVLASSIQVTPPKPQQITDPLDSLLSAIPNVFQFLQNQGIVLTQDPLTEYQTAASLYLQYKPQCLQNSDACLQMGDVLTHLETMRNDLEQILQSSNRTDLESTIDQMLQ